MCCVVFKQGKELGRRIAGELPENWKSLLPKYTKDSKASATRVLSGIVLNALAPTLTELVCVLVQH
jgi:transketolase